MEMADAVAAAMTEAEHLLVQAGTGTGKSLAYLVPALLYADAADKPAIIATATLALQAQLVDRDLPLLAGAVEPELGRPLGWATLKGRSNYACLHRVREGVPDDQGELVPIAEVSSTAVGAEVVRARNWAEDQALARATGDRDRLEPGISDRAWAQVSVTAQECLGAGKCPWRRGVSPNVPGSALVMWTSSSPTTLCSRSMLRKAFRYCPITTSSWSTKVMSSRPG